MERKLKLQNPQPKQMSNSNLRGSLETILEIIEKSDYIYSRKAFDKCPLPVLILSAETCCVEYANEEFVRSFGNPTVGTPSSELTYLNTSINRRVGSHDIRVLVSNKQFRKELSRELSDWLSKVSKPSRTSDLVAKTRKLNIAIQAFSNTMDSLSKSQQEDLERV